jgi:predicted enzyme related to lactoylglutathione lyase
MITAISFVTVWVLDQERAKDFYVNRLGFELRSDQDLGGFRWLTVAPRGSDVAYVLIQIGPNPMMDDAAVTALRGLVEKGIMAPGALATDDIQETYVELLKRGVKFLAPPQERPYGIEATFSDDSGNRFSLAQRRR